MKKHAYIFGLALVIAFITAQSFYYRLSKKAVTVMGKTVTLLPRHISVCAPPIIEDSLVADIPPMKGWGNYSMKITTTSDSAQFYFNQGLSMYYAFHTIEAYASFTKAAKIDPACAMAWYGKALAMGPTINYANDYKPSLTSYESASRSAALTINCTPVEKDLINAIQQRYSDDSTISVKQLRINYAGAMQKVYEKYPHNADVVTLYADALLLLHPWDLYTHDFKPKPWTPLIRSLLEEALVICPNHPGANHYYIHTLEASGTPGLALRSAHVLDTLMPSVSHVTHMPSHIYIRTGYYQQGINNNNAAVAGYRASVKQYKPVAGNEVLYEAHNIHLKVNCAQMGGAYKVAIDGAKELQGLVPSNYLGSKAADGNFFQYLYVQSLITNVRFGKWDEVLNTRVNEELPYASLLQHFSRGLAYCAKGNTVKAKAELNKLERKIQDKVLKSPLDNFSSAYEASCVARLILQGVLAAAEKQDVKAIEYLQKAVTAEDNLIYNEPRDWPLPTRHYLADVLIKAGKYNQAIAVLNKDLFINPNNGWALTGLQLACQGTKNAPELEKVKMRLKSALKISDVKIDRSVF
jgi:tetratricopeptide (TPR) repeat protein